MTDAIWRDPPAETEDFPGLVVCDNRVTGSITVGHTRLPLWCFVTTALQEGWDAVEKGWEPSEYGYAVEDFSGFLYDLLEQRGEFGRLLCILADVERRERRRVFGRAWWDTKSQRKRVIAQLERCRDALLALETRSALAGVDSAPLAGQRRTRTGGD